MALKQPALVGSQFARVGYPVRAALTDTRGGGYLLRGITESDPRWAIHARPMHVQVASMTADQATEAGMPVPDGAIGVNVYREVR